jgi:hypothetical protein
VTEEREMDFETGLIVKARKRALSRWNSEFDKPDENAIVVATDAIGRALQLQRVYDEILLVNPDDPETLNPNLTADHVQETEGSFEKVEGGGSTRNRRVASRDALKDLLMVGKAIRQESLLALDSAKTAASILLDRRRTELAEAEAAVTLENSGDNDFARNAKRSVEAAGTPRGAKARASRARTRVNGMKATAGEILDTHPENVSDVEVLGE